MAQVVSKAPKRRTQAERREAMRKRLLKATLDSLAQDGYIGTSVSSIVRRAGVSRGAQLHHYPSKNALILDAASYLVRRAYRVLGEMLLSIANEEDRLQALLDASWTEIFDTRIYRAYFELMIASQRDDDLAVALHKLGANFENALRPAVAHYFEKRTPDSEDPHDMFVATVRMLGAMAATSHFVQTPDETQKALKIWSRIMAGQMRARRGVRTPPPRPAEWNGAI